MVARLLKKIAFVVCIGMGTALSGQVAYSTRPDYLQLKREGSNLLSSFYQAYPDSNITWLSQPFPRNYLGNIGMPSPSYQLGYGTPQLGFRFFDPPTRSDRYLDEDVRYYRTRGPYASLTGIAGSKQLQSFGLRFTHTYKEKINVALHLNRYSSLGYYKRQQTYTNTFFLSSNYSGRRWGYYLYLINNSNRNQESGGLRDTTLNDSTNQISKELLPVKFNAATRVNRETRLMINPWLRLNRRPDSLPGVDHFVELKSTLSFQLYRYRDPNSVSENYYQQFLLDTAGTSDSSRVRQWRNAVQYVVAGPAGKYRFSAGYANEISNIWQEHDSLLLNHLAQAGLVVRRKLTSNQAQPDHLEMELQGQYVMAGPNANNYKLESRNRVVIGAKENLLFADLLLEQRNPDYFYNRWISNHFAWNNNYTKQQRFQARVGGRYRELIRLELFYTATDNFLYFDEVAQPRQLKGTVINSGAGLLLQKVAFKHLGAALGYTYQTTSAAQYQRIPPQIAMARLYYTGNLFKNNLQLQLGGQVQVYDAFTPYAYMPATQAFYLQNQVQSAAYPYLDIYLNARIRPVSFFLKMENVLNGRLGTDYTLVAGYYQSPAAFRFGLTWVFFD